MQFIIVADDGLAPLGRQLSHALSMQKHHTGSYWTVTHYKNNEAQLNGRQPVILLGSNDVAKSYIDVLPERFRGFGTKCAFEGAKAVLTADVPDHVSAEDLASLRTAVKDTQHELRRRAAAVAAAAAGATGAASAAAGVTGAMGASAVGLAVGVALWPWIIGGGLGYAVYRVLSMRWRRREYRGLQYKYALSRFLKDEFEPYVAGIEGH